MTELKLDLLQTLSLAAVVYYAGIQLRKRVRWLDRLNIPAAVVGGLPFTLLALVLHQSGYTVQFDLVLQPILTVAFFTSIGMAASLGLLRIGGVQVIIFLAMATLFCFVQNFLGIAIALGFDENPLLGVMAGSVTLVGGPATGLAFAPLFEQSGLKGAAPLALAAATAGIVCGGLVGGPVGTYLIRRFGLAPHASRASSSQELKAELEPPGASFLVEVDREDSSLIRNLAVLGAAMGLGSLVSSYIQSLNIIMPGYIGAMLVASVLRNVDDVSGWLRIDQRAMEFMGNLALNIFLVVALMSLKLWELAGLALPLLVILAAQILVVLLFAATVSFRVMGRDYESAVMASGFIGFVLGTTANAVANMRALVARFGPAPRAFLIVPLVGAFFIDLTNALIITWFVNWLK